MRPRGHILEQPGLFELPALQPPATKPAESLPILYQEHGKVSYSSLSVRDTCPRQYYLTYPGMWWGWDTTAPAATQEAYWVSRLTGWQGWAGHIVHDVAQALFWNDIDRAIPHLTGVAPRPEVELADQAKGRFEGEWNQSRQWTWETFRKEPRRHKPVWLKEHAEGAWPRCDHAADDDPRNLRAKRKCWSWIQRSLEAILRDREAYHERTPYERYLVIEGNRLRKGLIVQAPERKIAAQGSLRAKDVYPVVPFAVDGEVWQLVVKMDLMVYTPAERYLIIDFKTGKDRYWRAHRKQLELYAAVVLGDPQQFLELGFPPVTEENLVLRAVYTDPTAEKPWREWNVGLGDRGRFLHETHERIRRLRQHHLRLDELENDERSELRRTLPPRLFAGPEGLYEHDGTTLRPTTNPQQLVALPSLFPATQAQRGNVKLCEVCSCRSCCPEGTALLETAAKK